MAQDKIKINDVEIYQPDEGLQWNFETTFSAGSTRTQSGKGRFSPLFTVEQLTYTATDIPVAEASKILKMFAKGRHFSLHYFSVYTGKWQTGSFYVGQGDITIKTIKDNDETLQTLSFKMTGDDPI